MATTRGNLIGVIAAVCLFFIILFLMPTRVGAADFCNGRGYRNATDGLCSCISGFHGEGCEYKHCPFGKSWFSKPIKNNERNQELIACSNMGSCNPLNGYCRCREGFEGSACERMSCATTLTIIPDAKLSVNIALSGSGALGQVDSDLSNTPQCSGHGLCKTMREMGEEFNGYSLIRPPVNYNNWEADKLQSCLCDEGWEGYDCSQRSCPKGRDPTVASNTAHSLTDRAEEVFVLQCQADAGFFSILALGRYTEPIPFDADPGYLKLVLERISTNAGTVEVIMPSVDSQGGAPSVCGQDDVVSTQIVFTEHKGPRPPMLLSRNTSNTRMWPSGAEQLTLLGSYGDAILRFATRHELTCPTCPDCHGRVYFKYLNSISPPVTITALGAAAALVTAIADLEDLAAAQWTDFNIDVAISGVNDRICNTAYTTTTSIDLYSNYGNIPFLTLVDASYLDAVTVTIESANITMSTNAAADVVYECSNQGTCDYSSGKCQCFESVLAGDVIYRATSSDGNGNLGLIGDCGHIEVPVTGCLLEGFDVCNGQGLCSNTTGRTCDCFEGFAGITCELRECPKGRAWFDEPTAGDTAHDFFPCSNMGKCNSVTGVCKCRDGYSGPACDVRDCTRDKNYLACSGHGSCVNTATLFKLFGLSYGNVTTDYIRPGGDNWDAYSWHHCLCMANIGAGFLGDPLRPSVGPHALISGSSAGALPLPGWDNWDCSLRNCPKGHTSDRRHGEYAAKEIQRVVCGKQPDVNASDFFILRYMNINTPRIYSTYTAGQIKSAIEYHPYIGNVTINFPNYNYDNISTACNLWVNETWGGFTVQFDTEWGDLPLFHSATQLNLTVTEVQTGASTNLECGGSTLGFCDRISGTCVCNAHRSSSDGTGLYPGNAGDCSYFMPYPVSSQDTYTLFGVGKPDF